MKKIIVLIAFTMLSGISFSQCVNADFSLGNFTNWTGSVGTYSLGVYSPTGSMVVGTQNSNTYTTDIGRQTIITDTSLRDPETQNVLKETPPNGSNSCRLGNPRTGSCDGGKAQEEQLVYSYLVNSSNCIFNYQYAVVLHDITGGHTSLAMPKFSISIFNSLGVIVPDSVHGYFEVSGYFGYTGLDHCLPDTLDACNKRDTVFWKDWTSADVDLSGYIGQNITIQFNTRDCNPNGSAGIHFGYAYISCSCGVPEHISEFNENNFVQISPNPSNGVFTLSLQNTPNKNIELEIFNSLGQSINKDVLNMQTKNIDISRYPKGFYFLKISSEGKYLFKKIIKE